MSSEKLGCGVSSVACSFKCYKCGWNPEVAHKRVEKRYGKDAWNILNKIKITMVEEDRIKTQETWGRKCFVECDNNE